MILFKNMTSEQKEDFHCWLLGHATYSTMGSIRVYWDLEILPNARKL